MRCERRFALKPLISLAPVRHRKKVRASRRHGTALLTILTGSHPRECADGTAATFDQARADLLTVRLWW
jgi:hypothetical protein